MKKHILVSFIILVFVCSIGFYKSLSKNDKSLGTDKNVSGLYNSPIAVMIETDVNTGIYEQQKTSEWPTEGYIFNSSRSYCENDSEIIWNKATNSLNISVNKSDKCYVYFDKENIETPEDETPEEITE